MLLRDGEVLSHFQISCQDVRGDGESSFGTLMNPLAPDRITVFQSQIRRECVELRLVLEATGIESRIGQGEGHWTLEVSPQDAGRAEQELAAYQLEKSVDVRPVVEPTPLFQGAGWGVLVYCLFLISISLLATVDGYGWRWSEVGPMRAGEVVNGRWWQTVTALTLHADLTHLSSNLLFGSLFGFLAGRVLGGGVAWLSIVVAGAVGNFLNAMARQPEHVSIGASTAVFAALGILVAHALYPRVSIPGSAWKRFSPLIAGVVMLAFLGTEGERTDVLAHVTGFVAGLMIGSLGRYLPRRCFDSFLVQWTAASLTVLLLLSAWFVAIVTG